MTAPSLRALGAVTSGNTLSPSFAAPAGAVGTDVIVIIAFGDDGRTTLGALPTGFSTVPGTPQRNANAGSPNHNLFAWYGRYSDVGVGPYVVTLANGFATPFIEGRACAIQGCITSGSPWDATNGATSGAVAGSTAPLVTATSTGADRYALYAATNWNGGAWTPATGFTEQWDANTRIVTIDDAALPTVQTVTPQAVCAGNNLMNAWVGLMLPATTPSPIPGGQMYGSKTNPVAGDVIVSSGPLVGGRYRVTVGAVLWGTTTGTDANNMQLKNGAGTVSVLMASSTGRQMFTNPTMLVDVPAGGTLTVTAVGNSSGGGAQYGAQLTIKPDALYE